jgi:hypothetical protein
MAQWEHGGGVSVDGSVRIAAEARAGHKRRLRYCARPPFALDRLRELAPKRSLYVGTKLGPGGSAPLLLTPLELLDRLAALVPPPRLHCRHYFGRLVRTAAHRKIPRRPGTAAAGRDRQLMRRVATTASPGIAAIGGVIATGSKESAVAVQGSPPRCRAGGAPEIGSSARLFHTRKCQYWGVVVPEVASESVPPCVARRREWDIALSCKAAPVDWADVGNWRCNNG